MKKEETVETVVETKPIEETVIEETVKVRLPLSREKQADVFVSVNGKAYQIQRGVEVEVPRVVYEVLENSERMDNLALQRQNDLMRQSF